MSRRHRIDGRRAGMTLIEVFIASLLGVIIILAMGQVDVARIYLTRQARQATSQHSDAMQALAGVVRGMQQADLVVLGDLACGGGSSTISGSCVRMRIPVYTGGPTTSLDTAAGYRWDQYRFVDTDGNGQPDAVRHHQGIGSGSCGAGFLYRDISRFLLAFRDEALPAPPGGEAFAGGVDSNVVEIQVDTTFSDPQNPTAPPKIYTYTGEATLRAGAYTGLRTGLAPPPLDTPPPAC